MERVQAQWLFLLNLCRLKESQKVLNIVPHLPFTLAPSSQIAQMARHLKFHIIRMMPMATTVPNPEVERDREVEHNGLASLRLVLFIDLSAYLPQVLRK